MNQQASIEELKECREAFEDIFGKRDAMFRRFSINAEHDAAWEAWQAAWNRRITEAPAEVSSEGLHNELELMGKRLVWAMDHMGMANHSYEYCNHVLKRGGTGDLSDCITYIDSVARL